MALNWETMGIWFFDRKADHMYTIKGMSDDGIAPLSHDDRKAMAKRVTAALNGEDKTVTNVREKIKKAAEQSQAVFNGGGGTIHEAIDYFEQVLLGEFIE
uniref:Uncharacterized protein n=1 Tax=Pseudomonas phage Cygsa01 TaxID=3138529 RepID=A0AAU6W4Y2_9VIRU